VKAHRFFSSWNKTKAKSNGHDETSKNQWRKDVTVMRSQSEQNLGQQANRATFEKYASNKMLMKKSYKP